jgi:hypothetical protein
MKTPEEMAEEYCNKIADTHSVKAACEKAYVTGYHAGCEITDQEIVDIIIDMRKKEAEERSKLPPHQEQRHTRIWEKIKVKMIGIF